MVGKTPKLSCPICGKEAILSKTSLKLFDNLITLKNNPIYECKGCKERFATGDMVDEAIKNAKREFNFKRPVISTGGSLAITLPSDLSEYCNLKKGKAVCVIPESRKTLKIVC